MDLSIIIPVYKSANILPVLVNELRRDLHTHCICYEIILVNDCSPDNSWDVVNLLADKFSEVRGLSLRKNAGQHNAIMAGLNHAIGKVIVIMDDDFQHRPADVHRLYEKILAGYDACFVEFPFVNHSLWKRLGSDFNNLAASILLKKPKNLYLSSFKAISAGIRDEIIKYTGPYAYIDGFILMTTEKLTVITSEHCRRMEGQGSYDLWKSIQLWSKMVTSFSVLPLRITGAIGVFIAVAGLISAVLASILKIYTDLPIPLGWTSLIVSVMILGGTQLIALWVIGEYLGRSYIRDNKIPQYSIKEYKNFKASNLDSANEYSEIN